MSRAGKTGWPHQRGPGPKRRWSAPGWLTSLIKFVMVPVLVIIGGGFALRWLQRPELNVTITNLVDPPLRPNEPARYILKINVANAGRSEAHHLRIPISERAFDGEPSVFVEPALSSTLERTTGRTVVDLPVLPAGESVIVTAFGLLAPGISEQYLGHHGAHTGPEHPGMRVLGEVSCDERAQSHEPEWSNIDAFLLRESASAFPVYKFLAYGYADTAGARITPLTSIVVGQGTRQLRDLFAQGFPGNVPGGLMLINAARDTTGHKIDYLSSDVAMIGLMLPPHNNIVAWYYDLRCRQDSTVFSKVGFNVAGQPESTRWIRCGGGTWKNETVFLMKLIVE